MFTCKYADYISRDRPITFTQVSPAASCALTWQYALAMPGTLEALVVNSTIAIG